MLRKTLNAYHNRAIATQEVIEELIKLAKERSAATQRGVDEAMGNDELKVIAAELVTQVRKSVTIDWTLRAVTDAQQWPGFQSARAKIKVMVKRILRKHGYPPDLEADTSKPSSLRPSSSAPSGPRRL